jgi:hypothetical protein
MVEADIPAALRWHTEITLQHPEMPHWVSVRGPEPDTQAVRSRGLPSPLQLGRHPDWADPH